MIDSERLIRTTFLAGVEHHVELPSTQDRACALAACTAADKLPLLVIADAQTAGRGRGNNVWWSAEGSLAMSLVFDPTAWGLPARATPDRSLVIAVALVHALRELVPAEDFGLHWPNDVFVRGRKVSGLLIDVLPGGRHVVGIGINVNCRFDDAPTEIRDRAISLSELAGEPIETERAVVALLAKLDWALNLVASDPLRMGSMFHEACRQIGQLLTIAVGGKHTTGICAGIAPDGALLLETPGGEERFYAGTLVHAS